MMIPLVTFIIKIDDSLGFFFVKYHISYDVASGSKIMLCNKIDKPLVVYRFSGNVMTSVKTLCT